MKMLDPEEVKTVHLPKVEQVPKQEPPQPIEVITQEVKEIDETGFTKINGLPTDYILYPEGTVIKGRSMKVREVKDLSQMDEKNANDLINVILTKCTIGLKIEDMYAADKLYILFWLRANTYTDSGYSVSFDCPKCDNPSKFDFELDDLDVKVLSKENVDKLNQTLKLGGKTFTFKMLTVKDENESLKFIEDNKNSMMDFDVEVVALCKTIDTVDGKKIGTIQKYEIITDDFTAQEYSYFVSYVREISVGLEPLIKVDCLKCGGVVGTPLPFRSEFFLPNVSID